MRLHSRENIRNGMKKEVVDGGDAVCKTALLVNKVSQVGVFHRCSIELPLEN